MKWFKSCNVEQSIMGSDHCPVVAELHDTIIEDGLTYTLREEINPSTNAGDSSEPPKTPRLCAKYLQKFMGSQKTLKTFFTRSNEKKDEKLILGEQTGNDLMEDNQIENKQIENNEIDNQMEKELLDEPLHIPSNDLSISKGVITQSTTTANTKSYPKQTTTKKSTATNLPKGNVRMTKKKPELEKNQKSLVSFFKQQIPDKISRPENMPLEKDSSRKEKCNSVNLMEEECNQLNQFEEPSSDSSDKSLNEELTQQESMEEIKEIKDNLIENCKEIPTTGFNNNTSETISQWSALFTPRPIPKCKVHNEPCKEYRVNKPGPNQGRRFYLCSRYIFIIIYQLCKFSARFNSRWMR